MKNIAFYTKKTVKKCCRSDAEKRPIGWQMSLGMHNFRKAERETLRVPKPRIERRSVRSEPFVLMGMRDKRSPVERQTLPLIPKRAAAERRLGHIARRTVGSVMDQKLKNPVKVGKASSFPLMQAVQFTAFWLERAFLRKLGINNSSPDIGLWRVGDLRRKPGCYHKFGASKGEPVMTMSNSGRGLIKTVIQSMFPVDAKGGSSRFNLPEFQRRDLKNRTIRKGQNRREKRQSWVTFFARKLVHYNETRLLPKAKSSTLGKVRYYSRHSHDTSRKMYLKSSKAKFQTYIRQSSVPIFWWEVGGQRLGNHYYNSKSEVRKSSNLLTYREASMKVKVLPRSSMKHREKSEGWRDVRMTQLPHNEPKRGGRNVHF